MDKRAFTVGKLVTVSYTAGFDERHVNDTVRLVHGQILEVREYAGCHTMWYGYSITTDDGIIQALGYQLSSRGISVLKPEVSKMDLRVMGVSHAGEIACCEVKKPPPAPKAGGVKRRPPRGGRVYPEDKALWFVDRCFIVVIVLALYAMVALFMWEACKRMAPIYAGSYLSWWVSVSIVWSVISFVTWRHYKKHKHQ